MSTTFNLLGLPPELWQMICFYVEADDLARLKLVDEQIEGPIPNSPFSCVGDAFQVGHHETAVIPYVRSRVYGLRLYNESNLPGPFLDDGLTTVDWEMLEAIQGVLGPFLTPLLGYNRTQYINDTGNIEIGFRVLAFTGAGSNTCVLPLTKTLEMTDETQNPYNITGTWIRIFSHIPDEDIVTYSDLNVRAAPYLEPGDYYLRAPLCTEEKCFLAKMELHVTIVEHSEFSECCNFPIAHFEGLQYSMTSQQDPDVDGTVTGNVSMTRDKEIRWTLHCTTNNGERWRSEGIQIGGPNSGRGVLGTYFNEDDPESVCIGPTAYQKIKDTFDDNVMEWDSE
ncbi:MAG: hypothetical protein Q9219_006773 [cf. Caloplaca sp. 3 TL-2023]